MRNLGWVFSVANCSDSERAVNSNEVRCVENIAAVWFDVD